VAIRRFHLGSARSTILPRPLPARRADEALLAGHAVASSVAAHASDSGAHVTRSLARGLAAGGVVVRRGSARGVDPGHIAVASTRTRDGGGLGCGIDRD